MRKQIVGLIVVILLVMVVLSSFIIYNEWPLLTGKKIVLATQPVDPFDPFRGQYIQINYEISRINNLEGSEEGDLIYINLEKDESGIWRMTDASFKKPERGDFIRGEISNKNSDRISVIYGIEQYFFERNAEFPTSNISVEVSVANSGRAKISEILHNGKPVEINYTNNK